MKTIITTCALCIVLAVVGCGSGQGKQGAREPQVGGSLPGFTLKDVDGVSRSLSDYLGKQVILISFWATWCEPCKKEMIHLQKIYEQKKVKGFTVLSISMDEPETQGDAVTYAKQRGFTFPVLIDAESQVTQTLNPKRAAPFSMLVSREGKVVWSHEGFVTGDEAEIARVIDEALGPR